MKKKIISIIATVALVVTLIPSSNTNAYVVQNFFTEVDGIEWGYCVNTEGKATDVLPNEIPDGVTEITVPEELDGYTVIEVATNAFARNETITKIDLPSNLEYIQENVFRDCSNLTSVSIPYGVSYIGESAFSDCLSLTSIEMPDSVTSIGTESFRNCRSLNYLRLSENLEKLGYMAFQNDISLSHVEIPDNVKSIDNNSFSNCSSLLTLDFSETSKLDTIGLNAFSNCLSLYYVNLPNSLITIKDYAFGANYSLEELKIPSSVTSIGENSFDREASSSIATVYLDKNSFADGYKWDETFNIKYNTDEVPETSLEVSSITTSPDVSYAGVPIKIVTGVSGGLGDYQVQIETLMLGDGRFIVKEFCDDADKDYYWTPTKAGEYTITSIVRDRNGERATNSVNYVVKEGEKVTIDTPTTDLVSPQLENSIIKLTTEAHGGSGNYTYSYKIKSNLSETEASGNQSYSWNPKTSGTYLITSTVSEWDFVDGVRTRISSVTSEPVEFKIVRDLTMAEPTVNLLSPQVVGTTIGITSAPVNGYGELQSKVEVTKDSVTTLIKDYSEDTTTNWTPKDPGSYIITVTALDEMGTTFSKSLTYEITEVIPSNLVITSVNSSLASPQEEGTKIIFTSNSFGGEGKTLYKFEIFNGTLSELFQDYKEGASLTWIPSKPGNYTVKVTAKDSNGAIAEDVISYVINKGSVNLENTYLVEGDLIQIPKESIESLSNINSPIYASFLTSGIVNLSMEFTSVKELEDTMAKTGVLDLTFSFNDGIVSNEKFLDSLDKTTIVSKFSLDTNIVEGLLGTAVNISKAVDIENNGKTLLIYTIDSKGKLILVGEDLVENGNFEFSTTHFSDYVILSKELTTPVDVIVPVIPDDGATTGTIPKTGDSGLNSIYICSLLLLMSVFSIVFIRRAKPVKVKR